MSSNPTVPTNFNREYKLKNYWILLIFLVGCNNGSNTPPPPPEICILDSTLLASDPLCIVCPWDDTIIESNIDCQEPKCLINDNLVESDPLCIPCSLDNTIIESDPLCIPCSLDNTIIESNPLCIPCPWDNTIIESNPACTIPQCPWDDSILITNLLCVVCPWDDTIIESNLNCQEPRCIYNSDLVESDPNCFQCTTVLNWTPPIEYIDCDPDIPDWQEQGCGELLPINYLKQFNIFVFDTSTLENNILEEEVPNPNIITWELLNVPHGTFYYNMTASGYELDREPDPDSGIIPLSTSDHSNLILRTCP